MRIDPHPEDFLELDGQTRAAIRRDARRWPSGRPSRELAIDDLQRFIDGRMDEVCGPAELLLRQKLLTLAEKRKAKHRLELRIRWAAEDVEAAVNDVIDTLHAVLDYGETGDVDCVPVLETSEVAEKAIAEAIPANYTRTDADAVIAFGIEHGFNRVVDHSCSDDGTTRLILLKPPQSPFDGAVIQQCVEVKQRELLSCGAEQRLRYVADALALFEAAGGADLLPDGDAKTALVARIAIFTRCLASRPPAPARCPAHPRQSSLSRPACPGGP